MLYFCSAPVITCSFLDPASLNYPVNGCDEVKFCSFNRCESGNLRGTILKQRRSLEGASLDLSREV